jgi:DNA-binding MarR family transcriptional regulator
MHPNSIASKIMRLLQDGPAVTSDVVVELGMRPHDASNHLFNLEKRGKITKTPFPGKRRRYLWELIEQEHPGEEVARQSMERAHGVIGA